MSSISQEERDAAHGLSADLAGVAEALLAKANAAGAEAADVVVQLGESLSVSARGGALEEVERAESVDFGLRALISGPNGWREATVSASDPSDDALTALAERAAAMAREAPENPHGGLSDPAERLADPASAVAALGLDADEPAPSAEALLDTALALEAATLRVSGVAQIEGATAGFGGGERLLATSDGFIGRYREQSRMISVSAVAGEGVGMERDYAYSAARRLADLRDVEAVGREAGERAVRRLQPRKAKAGAYPALYEPRVAAGVVSGLLGALNGEAVARGSSFLAKKRGERILPERFDLIDDPTLAAGLGSRPFDGEGLAGRRKRLIEGGVVADWLLDGANARKLGLKSNGSASRGVGGGPAPGASNAWITAGATPPEALMREIGEGLLITEMMGRGLNPVTGDYSRGASGFWIENGEIAYPVSELTVAGHMLEMAASLVAADDLVFDRRVVAPTLRIEGLTIGAA